METPIVSCFSESEAASVYEPAEDSFLLIDALEKELPEITRRRPSLCVEVGSGSGIVIAALAKALGRSCCFIATDINEKAAAMTKRTCERNGADVDVVVSDLVECLADRLQKKVDLLVFNPPYVVTPTEEEDLTQDTCSLRIPLSPAKWQPFFHYIPDQEALSAKDPIQHIVFALAFKVQGNQLLTRSWAGGIKGREVMDRLAPYVSQILSDRGLYFLLLIKENDPDDVCKLMSTHGLQGKCVIARRCGAEHLSVWRFEKCMNKS